MGESELLDELRAAGVDIWTDGAELRYRAPAGALTESHKRTLRAKKRELIALLAANDLFLATPPHADDAEAVWLPTETQFGFAADPQPHHFQRIVRIAQPYDRLALEAAVNYLVRRHSVLRTRYLQDDRGRLWAATVRERPIKVDFVDLRGLEEDRREAAARQLALATTRQPFELRKGPVLRVALVQLRDEEFVLVFVVHHSVFDGWSATIWANELDVAYRAFAAGTEPGLAPLPLQFHEFATEQRAFYAGPAVRGHLAWWREKFRGAARPFWLPRDRRTPFDSAVDLPPTRHRLGKEAVDFLRDLSRRADTTLLVTTLTLFGAVLRRWSSFDEVFVWACHTGRLRPELHGLIGCLCDVWPLRMDLSGNPRFAEALERVKRVYFEALPHIGVTGLKLAPELSRAHGRRNFPSIIFNYLPESAALESSGAGQAPARRAMTLLDWVAPSGRFAPGSPHALAILPFDRANSFGWHIQHAAELFEDATVERASNALARAIELLRANPDARLDDIVTDDIAGPGAQPFEAGSAELREQWWDARETP